MFRLLIVGSRSFSNYDLLKSKCDYFLSDKKKMEIEIVSGGARGADSLAEKYAAERGYALTIFRADWTAEGRRAGYLRNEQMHQYIAQVSERGCVAFWDGQSPGTRQSFELAKKHKNPLRIVRYDLMDR